MSDAEKTLRALLGYLLHKPGCGVMGAQNHVQWRTGDEDECTCGLAALLPSLPREDEGPPVAQAGWDAAGIAARAQTVPLAGHTCVDGLGRQTWEPCAACQEGPTPPRDEPTPAGHHNLKVWPEYFAALASGRNTFEVRKNDRDFREGDTLTLREWRPDQERYTLASIDARIAYVLYGGQFGIEPGYVVLGLDGPVRAPAEAVTVEQGWALRRKDNGQIVFKHRTQFYDSKDDADEVLCLIEYPKGGETIYYRDIEPVYVQVERRVTVREGVGE